MTLEEYINANKMLARSITIKSSHQADLINNYIISKHGSIKVNSEDYTTWRYYLNLNGEYHFTNNDVYVYVLETDETALLTKELLDTYKNTKAELEKFDTFYKRVLGDYPTDELLIKGIISPVEPSVVYELDDGEIISYSSYYVHDNELSIIRSLNTYLRNTYTRWFNPYYLNTDTNYLAVFLTQLYVNMPIKIELLRLENIHTHKAHSFHVDTFFSSTLNIDPSYMNAKSKFWLYQNLKTLMIHAGKNETLEEIITNVLTPNTVGIGKLSIEKAKPTLLNDISNPNDYSYTLDEVPSLIIEPMNDEYDLDGVSLTEVVSMEYSSGYLKDDITVVVEEVSKLLKINNEISLPSKVVHLAFKGISELMDSSRLNIIMDSIFYLSDNSTVVNRIIFTDSNTSITYNLSYDQGTRLLMSLLLGYTDTEIPEVIHVESKNIVTNRSTTNIKDVMVMDNRDLVYIDYLLDNKPNLNASYDSMDYITNYVSGVITFHQLLWVVQSILNNPVSEENVEVLSKRVCYDTFTVNINSIEDELGIDTSVSGYDHLESIKTLLLLLTENIIIDTNAISVNTINSYVSLLKKTTSYNLQIINSDSNFNTIDFFDNNIGILRAKPIIDKSVIIFNGLENIICDPTIYSIQDPLTEINYYSKIVDNSSLVNDLGCIIGEHTLPNLVNKLTFNDVDDLIIIHESIPVVSPEAVLMYDSGYISQPTKLVETTRSNINMESNIYVGNQMIILSEMNLEI